MSPRFGKVLLSPSLIIVLVTTCGAIDEWNARCDAVRQTNERATRFIMAITVR